MVCKNRGICGFLGPSWVLITYNVCPPGIVAPLSLCTPFIRMRANEAGQSSLSQTIFQDVEVSINFVATPFSRSLPLGAPKQTGRLNIMTFSYQYQYNTVLTYLCIVLIVVYKK